MTLQLWVQAPTLGAAPFTIYESGMSGGRLYPDRLGSIMRRADLYTGRDAVASAGTLTTVLDNRDGLFSPDGIFAPRWRDVTLVARIDNRVVFVGRAEKTGEGLAGTKATVQWRDLVDDFLAQQVPGTGETDTFKVAETGLVSTLTNLGVDATGVTDVNLWLPEETTSIRRWLLPALSILGYSIDWSATLQNGQVAATLVLQRETAFGNQAEIPRFRDAQLVGDAKWDSGRDQVFNIWEGKRRFFDAGESKFEEQTINAYGETGEFTPAFYSREHFGERKARLDLRQLRMDAGPFEATVDAVINRRAWPHSRAEFTLRGADAAALKIGDGMFVEFGLGISSGRGLAGVFRVYGRTVDLLREQTKIYCEARDGRDVDFQAWQTAGANIAA